MPNGMKDIRDFQQMSEPEFRMYLFMELREIRSRLDNKNFWKAAPLAIAFLVAMVALITAIAK